MSGFWTLLTLTVDVLRHSKPGVRTGFPLRRSSILPRMGCPPKPSLSCLQQGSDSLVNSFLDWERPGAMPALWRTVSREGGVMASRRAREDAGTARVMGFSDRNVEREELDEDGLQLNPLEQGSVAWWEDETSGCPSALEETVMLFLQAGFKPQTCPILASKLKAVLQTSLRNQILNLRLELEMGLTAFIIPGEYGFMHHQHGDITFSDPRNVLQPGRDLHTFFQDVGNARWP